MRGLTVVAAAAPSLVLLAYFHLRDRYEREPLGHLLLTYALGMYALLAAQGLFATDGLLSWLDGAGGSFLEGRSEPAKLLDAFVLAGLLEESTKWVLLLTAVYHWREFDEPLDGLIYGVALSLGFATLENLHYLMRHGLVVAWPRALLAVPAHALFGGSMGYYAGRAKFTAARGLRWRDLARALIVPALFHGAYDFALLHGLGWKVRVAVAALSVGLWIFVLRRVRRAERASPYRPKTLPPSGLRPPQC
jgi:RsiW-degrading membrane proteinase PrsW (M82 family)